MVAMGRVGRAGRRSATPHEGGLGPHIAPLDTSEICLITSAWPMMWLQPGSELDHHTCLRLGHTNLCGHHVGAHSWLKASCDSSERTCTALLSTSMPLTAPDDAIELTHELPRRTFLIRDVMDEMLLNGLAPDRVFLELSIMHCMRSSRIGDCFFYYNEMKRRGMQPSSKLQGLLISVLSREGHLQAAVEVRPSDSA